jgi:hypothetical protein
MTYVFRLDIDNYEQKQKNYAIHISKSNKNDGLITPQNTQACKRVSSLFLEMMQDSLNSIGRGGITNDR